MNKGKREWCAGWLAGFWACAVLFSKHQSADEWRRLRDEYLTNAKSGKPILTALDKAILKAARGEKP